MRLYHHVGPKEIAARAASPAGAPITAPGDVLCWVRESGQSLDPGGHVVATFVVDPAGVLLVADRHSEHVACGGGPVLSAGEITFRIGRAATVAGVSNQSTGYCPEPLSWPAVELALRRAGLDAPARFDPACDFRLCLACGARNLVKGLFECAVCAAELPAAYNCQASTAG